MTIQVNPVRRNLKFSLPKDQITTWNKGHLHISHFFNALSVFFPVGERFFINSIRNYRNQVEGDQLKEDIGAFIAQEAFHGREHEEYNAALTKAGIPADRMERRVYNLLEFVKRWIPKSLQLGTTVALEHLTAVLGDMLLREPAQLEDAEPHYAALWRWHALEETEHKAVAFDVFSQVVGTGIKAYFIRTSAFIIANIIFWTLFTGYYFKMVKVSGGARDLKGWKESFVFWWVKPGGLRKVLPAWFDFFRPGFHPWMHDNRHLLDQMDEVTEQVDYLNAQSEKAA
ncbi:metal-dependent hydrolase [Hydrocarboniclastica marina]|uniref:Metal-dependent hydrolase n=1 Tax=Hydrocarboniclastica marina TaxID=2259620 RepID=A0A4V1D8N3_9ALTE|nr:metal-dependent hydrolase [Hydrocarboniclastica marina]MAL98452.1 metal-dependent hydrolase [Alteromonadaceae bacterium]QCF25790.1 metal-dependent hydrolase [Hydrocarboniclastica marina]|tara:strand:+ start:1348 stop:2202 length:855 start_codon:yes stop_codon:yes gene_type:complete